MNDELRKLEERIASLERKVRLLYTAIGVTSIFVGLMAYLATVDAVGTWIAVGLTVVVWAATGLFLHRSEFKGTPKHIEYINWL